MALLDTDVDFKVVKEFVAKVKDRAIGAEMTKSLTPGQEAVDRVAGSEPQPFEHEHEGREGDPEADDRDMNRERERLHLPCLQQVLLVDRRERSGDKDRNQAGTHERWEPTCATSSGNSESPRGGS